MSDYQKLKELYQQTCAELKETKKLLKLAYKRENAVVHKLQETEEKLKKKRKEVEEYKFLLATKVDNINNMKENVLIFKR